MAEIINTVGFDTSDSQHEIRGLAEAIDLLRKGMTGLEAAGISINDKNQIVRESFRELTSQGEKLSVTFNKLDGEVKSYSVALTGAIDYTKKLEQAQKNLAAQLRATQAVQSGKLPEAREAVSSLQKEFGRPAKSSTEEELETFRKARAAVTREIIEQGATVQDFQDAIKNLNSKDLLTPVQERIRGIVLRFKEATEATGTFTRSLKDADKIAERVEKVRQGLLTRLGPIPKEATTKEIENVQKRIAIIAELVGSAKVNARDVANLFKSVESGTLKTFTGAKEDLRQAIVAFIEAKKQLGLEAAKESKRTGEVLRDQASSTAEAKIRREGAIAAGEHLQTAFPLSRKATVFDKEDIQRQIASVMRLIDTGRVSAVEFGQVLRKVKLGETGALPGNLETVRQRLVDLKNTFEQAGKSSASAGRATLLSWTSVLRLFEAQLLHTFIARIVQDFHQATQAAAEFSRTVSLIQTISQDSGISFEKWQKEIKAVSDAFGQPITEVASSAYELLSNQVTKSTESFEVLSKAIEFGRTTNTNATDSINLLSSVINAFKLDISQTDKVLSSFFTIIDLGRIKGQDLADTIGRSAVIANTLGLSYNELGAALSSMTRQGIKAEEAMTLINNVLKEFIKPNEALKKFFQDIGVESGEAAISTYGFTGVLEKLQERTGGASEKIAELLPNLRSLRGGFFLLGPNLKEFTNDLKKLEEGTPAFDRAKKLVDENFGQKFKQQLNEASNTFAIDFGNPLVETTTKIIDKLGGMNNIIEKGTFLIYKIGSAIAVGFAVQRIYEFTKAVGTMQAALTVAELRTYELGVAIKTALASYGPLITGALIFEAFTYALEAQQRLREELKRTKEEFVRNAEEESQIVQRSSDEQKKVFIEGLTEQQRAFLQHIATLRERLDGLAEKQVEVNKKITDSLKASLNVLDKLLSGNVSKLEELQKKAEDNIKRITEEIQRVQEEAADKALEVNKKRFPNQAIQLTIERIKQLKAEAEKEFQTNNIDRAIERLRKALELGREASEATGSAFGLQGQPETIGKTKIFHGINGGVGFGGAGLEKIGSVDIFHGIGSTVNQFQLLNNITKDTTNELQKQLAVQIKQRDIIRDQQLKEEQRLAKLKVLSAEIEKFKPFNEKTKLFDEKAFDDLKTHQREFLEELKNVQYQSTSAPEFLKFKEQREIIKEQFKQQIEEINRTRDVSTARTGVDLLRSDTEKGISDFKSRYEALAKARLDIINKIRGKEGIGVDLQSNLNAVQESFKTVGGRVTKFDLPIFNQLRGLQSILGDKNLLKSKENIDILNTSYQKLLDSISKSSVVKPERALVTTTEGYERLDNILINIGGEIQAVTQRFEQLQRIEGQISKLKVEAGLEGALQSLNIVPIEEMINEIDKVTPSINNAKQSFESFSGDITTSINAARSSIEALRKDVEATANSMKSLGSDGASAAGHMMGGPIYHYAGGGFVPFGTDTQPAMLTPGEFVVNRAAAATFAPQLRALNAGQMPQFNNNVTTSGDTHNNYGDINITMNNPVSPALVRDLANRINIERKRGTIR